MSIAPATLHLNGARHQAAPIRRGDTFEHSLVCWDVLPDGTREPSDKGPPIEWLAQIRKKKRSTEILATFTVVVGGGDSNIVTWSLTADETAVLPRGRWWWDLQETRPGSPDIVITRLEGYADVDMDVSRAA